MILSPEQTYAILRAEGASHEEAVMLTAIAGPESGYNTQAHNPNASTGDNSYGLWQINMLGSLGPARLAQFGISSNDELFDPYVNARAALQVMRDARGFTPWTTYNNGLHEPYLPAATSVGQTLNDGDRWRNVATTVSGAGGAGRGAGVALPDFGDLSAPEGVDPADWDRLDPVMKVITMALLEKYPQLYFSGGFRTPEENASISGAAPNSLHMQGLAVDLGAQFGTYEEEAAFYTDVANWLEGAYPDISVVRDWDHGTGPHFHFSYKAGTDNGAPLTGSAGGATTYSAQGGVLPPNASPEEIEAYLRENYPQYVGFLEVPEIRDLLITAARENWTGTKLTAEVQQSEWWRTTAPSVRSWMATYATDPAAAAQQLDQQVANLTPLARQFGIANDATVATVAEQSLRYGWNDQQIRGTLAMYAQARSNEVGFRENSQPDVYADQLMQLARSEYLIPLNRQDVEKWVTQINAGLQTEDQFLGYVQRMAEGRFGWVDGSVSPAQYLAPIRNLVAETLEINPEDIDFLDRRWTPLLEHEGQGGVRPMTFAEAQRWARNQQDFRYTETAQSEAAQLGQFIGQTFGMVA